MQTNLRKLETITKNALAPLEGTAHSYRHIERVTKIATFIALQEKADVEIVRVSSILHDIGRSLGQPHNQTGATLAKRILAEIDYPQEKIDKVSRIILCHPIDYRQRLTTPEERIVWDADKIDLLGAVGIARAFHWGGSRPFETVLEYCLKEISSIYGLLNTPKAKRIAKRRQRRTTAFLSALKEELSLKDLGID
jgi:uncharacterized protein